MGELLGDAAMACLLGAGGCLASGRWAIPRLARAQYLAPSRYDDCPPLQAYQHAKPRTPTMGGVFAVGSAVAAVWICGGLASRNSWLVLAAMLGMGAIGLVDDWMKFRGSNAVGVRTWPKLLAALTIGAVIGGASGSAPAVAIPWTGRTVQLGWAWLPFAAMVLAGCSHAVNLTDGMDGLAAGCLAIAFAAIGVWSAVRGPEHRPVVLWCAALTGACLAFLWFNSYPAAVYLGDVGALGFGAALAAISLVTQAALWLLIIGAVFVVEAGSVMVQVASYKWRGQRRVFRVAPIHHHFHLGGLSEPKVIVRFWLIGAAAALVGLTAVSAP